MAGDLVKADGPTDALPALHDDEAAGPDPMHHVRVLGRSAGLNFGRAPTLPRARLLRPSGSVRLRWLWR